MSVSNKESQAERTFSKPPREWKRRHHKENCDYNDCEDQNTIELFEHWQLVSLFSSSELCNSGWVIQWVWDYFRNVECLPFSEYMIHKRNPLSVNARGITNNNRTSADVDSNSSSTIPIAYKTLKRKISPVSIKAKKIYILPNMKWATARAWHLSIVRPSDSLTTLSPRETTRSIKKDMEFRPASRMATGGKGIFIRGLCAKILMPTNNEERSRCSTSSMSI